MKLKMPSIVHACVGPSPTTDDGASTSTGRRGSSRSQAAPDGLDSRSRSPETQEGQRPRRSLLTKLAKGVMNAPHAMAVRVGISESRRAAAAAAAAAGSLARPERVTLAGFLGQPVPPPRTGNGRTPQARANSELTPPSPTQATPPPPVNLWALLDQERSQPPRQSPTQPAPVNLWTLLEEHGHKEATRTQDMHASPSTPVSSPDSSHVAPHLQKVVNEMEHELIHEVVRELVHEVAPLPASQPPQPRLPQIQEPSQSQPPSPRADWMLNPSVGPSVPHEITPVPGPEVQPLQKRSLRTRLPSTLPPRPSHRGSSSTTSLDNTSPQSRLQPPLPPLVLSRYNVEQTLPPTAGVTPPLTPPLTPPVTPRATGPTATTQPQPTHLPSRRDAIAGFASQALNQMRLLQAGKAVANDSLVRELGATANTLLKPLQLAKDTGATLLQAGASWLNRPRQSSEMLQDALQGHGVDLSQPVQQEFVHALAVDYGERAATVLDTALPMVHSILKIGVAGTAMAFGAGRSAGLSAGDALGRLERGVQQATGVRSGPEAAAAPLQSGTAFKLMGGGAQQLVLGSLMGAVGNLTGQYLAAPLVNMIPRQFAPIDLRAVLPDETVALMNQLQPGAGDALRKQVQEAQRDVATINSASNVRLGQIAFDAITAARWATQGGLPLGVAGQVGIGLAVSSSAGMAIGAVMAARQSVASHQVPDLPALREAAKAHAADPGSDGAAALAQVDKCAVPLFFPRQINPAADPHTQGDIETGHGEPVANATADQRGRLARMRDTAQWAIKQVGRPLVAVGQAWGQSLGSSPLFEPAAPGTNGAVTAGRVVATASNVAASVVNRAGEMAKATLTTQAWSTASAMLASTTDGPAREFILAMGNAVGIHAAIKPWFDSLVAEIPQGDAKIRAHREQVLNR